MGKQGHIYLGRVGRGRGLRGIPAAKPPQLPEGACGSAFAERAPPLRRASSGVLALREPSGVLDPPSTRDGALGG